MKFSIIIPAHNEADVIGLTLDSLVKQSLQPHQVIVVNDNSSDNTNTIVSEFTEKHTWIYLVENKSSNQHLPGSKIINAFYKGLETANKNYDIICKFDADLIFPSNYLEALSHHFNANPKLGMAAGFCDIEVNGKWQLENLTNKDHIRGALKAYTKTCFEDIGQLKRSMGWDTIDELLAKYYKYEIKTIDELRIKHLKPTGISYNKNAKYLQGEAMYKMRNGFILTLISAVKLSLKKRSFSYFTNYIVGYIKATFNKPKLLVTKDQGRFIRNLRWKGVKTKLF